MVRPWVEKAGATFAVGVDRSDVLGSAFGLKAIPVSFLVDEVGIIRLRGGGPSAEFLAEIEGILKEPVSGVRSQPPRLADASPIEELRGRVVVEPDRGGHRLALAQALERAGWLEEAEAEATEAVRRMPNDAQAWFTRGLVRLRREQRDTALRDFREAQRRDPGNWRIRKQIWALENPERFYGPEGIDWAWQREEVERERGEK